MLVAVIKFAYLTFTWVLGFKFVVIGLIGLAVILGCVRVTITCLCYAGGWFYDWCVWHVALLNDDVFDCGLIGVLLCLFILFIVQLMLVVVCLIDWFADVIDTF